MELKIVITTYGITNPAERSKHYGYHCNGIMINLAFFLDFFSFVWCALLDEMQFS